MNGSRAEILSYDSEGHLEARCVVNSDGRSVICGDASKIRTAIHTALGSEYLRDANAEIPPMEAGRSDRDFFRDVHWNLDGVAKNPEDQPLVDEWHNVVAETRRTGDPVAIRRFIEETLGLKWASVA